MAKKQRSESKSDMKNEVSSYNQRGNRKLSLKKEDIERSNIFLTDKQRELYKMIRNNTFTIVQGPAGTSKTFTACYTALNMLADKKVDRIVLTKPIKESGEELGHLPGDIEEKTAPFMRSYFSNFEKIIGKHNVDMLKLNGEIQVEPLAYMRGVTYDDAIILLDEAQNATMKQLMLWITRLGKNSKAILMGDVSQFDIRKSDSKFLSFINMIDGVPMVSNFQFASEDIVRNKILIDIVNKYESFKHESKN